MVLPTLCEGSRQVDCVTKKSSSPVRRLIPARSHLYSNTTIHVSIATRSSECKMPKQRMTSLLMHLKKHWPTAPLLPFCPAYQEKLDLLRLPHTHLGQEEAGSLVEAKPLPVRTPSRASTHA
jgi:hypothetical protein